MSQLESETLAQATQLNDRIVAKTRNYLYPKEIWWFVAAFIGFCTLCQLASYIHTHFLRKRDALSPLPNIKFSNLEEKGKALPSISLTAQRSLRRIPLAILNMYRVVAFRMTVTFFSSYTINFAEVFVTMAYIAALFIWTFINTTSLEGAKFESRYFRNRAGAIATSQIPLVTALGTKNNLISYITGVGHDKLNYMHRMTARATLAILWVHTIAWGVEGIPTRDMSAAWMRLGITAMVAFIVLSFLSVRPVRNQTYELFYYVHFATVLIFLVGGYYHVKLFSFDPYIIAAFVIWALDRSMRFGRIIYFALASRFGSSAQVQAKATLVSPHLVRLSIPRPKGYHWSPGQTVFLTLPTISAMPWESHPFTIANIDGSKVEPAMVDNLVFLITTRLGFTGRLRTALLSKSPEKIDENPTLDMPVIVAVDGPYGSLPIMDHHDTIVLIAGGSGIAHTLPILQSLISQRSSRRFRQRILFVWCIREIDHLSWVDETLLTSLSMISSSTALLLDVDIRIHVTSSRSGDSPDEDAAPAESQTPSSTELSIETLHNSQPQATELLYKQGRRTLRSPLTAFPCVTILEGRPNITKMLKDEAESAPLNGSMDVTVCGSHSLMQAVRNGLKLEVAGMDRIMRGGANISLHVESFGY